MVRKPGNLYQKDLPDMTDEELWKELCDSNTPGALTYQMCEAELERRHLRRVEGAVNRLELSSKRIEWLSWALVGLTLALLLAAFPPAWDVVIRWLSK